MTDQSSARKKLYLDNYMVDENERRVQGLSCARKELRQSRAGAGASLGRYGHHVLLFVHLEPGREPRLSPVHNVPANRNVTPPPSQNSSSIITDRAQYSSAVITTVRFISLPVIVNELLETELSETAYALDSTTIDLCLPIFPWATFRTTKAAVKMHTLLDLRGPIPSFIHISDGKLHHVNVLDLLVPEAGATYVMDRAYVDFQRLYALHQAGAFSSSRAPRRTSIPIASTLPPRTERLASSPIKRSRWNGVRTK